MIEAGLEFQASARRLVVESFLLLPGELRPTHESANEDEAATKIQDYDKFLEGVMKHETGFFLKGPSITYDISLAGNRSIICNCFLDVDPALAKIFLTLMAKAQPVFGFACAPEEREYRNRVTIKQGVNTIESWVGRDTQKYIPGLYWLTLLPAELAEKRGASLSVIGGIALEHLELEGQQHLFRFYEKPENWRSAAAVKELCSSLPGIFDIEKVRPQLESAKTFLELNTMINTWK